MSDDGEVWVDPLHRLDGEEERPPLVQTLDVPIDESDADKVEARRAARQPLAEPRPPRPSNGPVERRSKDLVLALERLPKAKPQRGGRWGRGCCPAHKDDSPSLGWRVMDDGTVLLNCFAGCAKEAILSALGGFLPRDMFATDSSVSRYGKARLFAYRDQQDELQLKSRDFAKGKHDGIQTETGFKFQEVLPYGSGWLRGSDDTITVVEGERDAHTLKEMGIPVVALPGAGWRASGRALNLFVGREVFLWHDRDDAGVRAMDALADSVREQATRIRVVRLTSLPSGTKDVSDVYAAGGADEVIRVLTEAEVWEPSRPEPEPEPEAEAEPEPEPILDYPYFMEDVVVPPSQPPYNGLWSADSNSIMFGPGGTGKGVLAAESVCRMLREGRRVVILDYEGHPEEWKPRVESLYRATYEVDIPPQSLVYLPPRDRKLGLPPGGLREQAIALSSLMSRLGRFDNVVIDSALRAVGIDDPNSTTAVVQYGDAIDILGLPSLTFSHTTKTDDDPRYPYGSVWWHDWPRMTWGVTKVEGPNGAHGLVMKNRKNQNGPLLGVRKMTVHWSITGALVGVTVDAVEELLLDRLVEWLEARESNEPTTGWADAARGLLEYEAKPGDAVDEDKVRLESNNIRRLIGRIPPGDNRVEVSGVSGQLRASKRRSS